MSTTDYVTCPACAAQRLPDRFVGIVCEFCHEEGRLPVEAPLETAKPGRKPRARVAKPLESERQVDTQVVNEPYTPPKFDKEAAKANPAAELAARTLARRRLLPFIKRFRPKYDAGWVHEDICRRLERFLKAVEDGEEPRLLLMMPPRAGKSEIGSRHFAPWVLGQHPDWEIIAASHTTSLSLSFSRYIRDLLRDPAYHAVFPDAILDPQSQSTENWNLTEGGGYLAAGVGSAITGRGAHILILDDLVKDIEAADSQGQRDSTWEWYISTAHSRLAPGGGVLGIMCMTGDTPVLMADGRQRRLDTLKPSDSIATYARGTLARTRVTAVKQSGRDSVFKMTMNSGKIVRANQRHPFLTVAPNGELSWTRLKHLTTAKRIVTLKDNGVNGEALTALQKGVRSLPSVADFATVIMPRSGGLPGTEQKATQTLLLGATHASSTGMESPLQTTTACTASKAGVALSVANLLKQAIRLFTGRTNSQSTTATTLEKCEDCSVTTATQELDILLLSQWHLPPLSISDFTLDEIVSIEPDGVEAVFDVQVADTENFIANGLVSHNTWWSEDDWAGRIQQVMAGGEGEQFEIVRYPAINEVGDEYILPDDTIREIPDGAPVPEGARMTRPHMSALHEARYTIGALFRKKANYIAAGLKRMWDSLYQQNPTPDEGIYFSKDMFQLYAHTPQTHGRFVYQAWDFAITEGTQNDWTVGATILQDEFDNLYVLDMLRFRSNNSIEISDTILDYHLQWGSQLIGFEDGQIWKTMMAPFKKRCEERRVYPAYENLVPLTDKMVRANPLKGRMQLGKVYFPQNASWFPTCQREMLRFPAGKHDDQVDALSWCIRLTLSRSAPKLPEAHRLRSWRDKLNKLGMGEGSHMAA